MEMTDRESIIKKCQECIDSGEPSLDYHFYYAIIRLLKEQQETIASLQDTICKLNAALGEQPEIVRCKDCKYCFAEGFVHEHNICDKHEWIQGQPDDWFCADGERR